MYANSTYEAWINSPERNMDLASRYAEIAESWFLSGFTGMGRDAAKTAARHAIFAASNEAINA